MDAFDTETVNRPGGGHACLLVTSGDYLLFPRNFAAVFRYLARGKISRYVCWNMDFDVQSIVHENLIHWKLPLDLASGRRVKYRGYLFDYIPGKRFSVSRGGQTVELFDLWQFYQCSLRTAAERYLDAEEKADIPRHWYNKIDVVLQAGGRRAKRVIDYAVQDAAVTAKLYRSMADKLGKLGLSMERPVSAGSVSMTRWAGKHTVPPHWVNTAFADSYYGGRVECHTLGHIEKPTYLYDIKSAYPAVIRSLPGIRGLTFGYGTNHVLRPDEQYGAYRVRVKIPPDVRYGPLAKRSRDGLIFYPVGHIDTWVGLDGLKLIIAEGWEYTVRDYYCYYGDVMETPFADIDDLFAARKDPELKLAAKLVMNSAYGKLAEHQEFQGKVRWGQYACVPMAAAITERTRLKLWRTMRECGRQVYFCATDSLLLDGELACPPEPGLGDWERKEICQSVDILGTGRYILWPGEQPEIHLRGFDCDAASLRKLQKCGRNWATLKVFRATSIKMWSKGMLTDDVNVLRHETRKFRVRDQKFRWPDGLEKLPISRYFKECFHGEPWICADF